MCVFLFLFLNSQEKIRKNKERWEVGGRIRGGIRLGDPWVYGPGHGHGSTHLINQHTNLVNYLHHN